ncbi:MAG: SpoIID/LytB domain-containing protein, partial [Clostridia bacterium]|nr:SpoIID/LytB domain-containing protein [Clostridia bacterium]
DVDGVALSNMLPMEDYIVGVVPYEVNPEWHEEALRAFSITVRCYTVQNRNRHYSTYGFDLCNSQHCQVYRGITRANEAVFDAVENTKGLVLTDGEKVITTYYSSSMGGYTASAKDTWGGDTAPYMIQTYTPWERYSEHAGGIWTSEFSGAELAEYLRSKGYDEITGKKIVDIRINAYSGDSPYVYSITYTDSDENELTIERCDKVRSSMYKYLGSANFVVGKGSVVFDYDEVVDIDVESLFGAGDGGGYVAPIDDPVKIGSSRHTVLTGDGEATERETRLYVMTADDVVRVRERSLYVATADTFEYLKASEGTGVTLMHHTEVLNAEDADNFIVAGKGSGHGVGISQYGTLDLAEAGATAEQILALYFPDLMLCDYHELD